MENNEMNNEMDKEIERLRRKHTAMELQLEKQIKEFNPDLKDTVMSSEFVAGYASALDHYTDTLLHGVMKKAILVVSAIGLIASFGEALRGGLFLYSPGVTFVGLLAVYYYFDHRFLKLMKRLRGK